MTAADTDDGSDSAESPPDRPENNPVDEPGSFTERLTLIENGLEALAGRLDDTEDAIATTLETIGGEITDLKANLAQLIAQERELVKPRRWAARASRDDWNNLVNWVDELTGDCSLLSDYTIPPCWPAHPGVVEELAGLWRSWIHAVINDARAKKHGSADLTAWHDRWLWPCLVRLKSGHYRITNCRQQHQLERSGSTATDRDQLPFSQGCAEKDSLTSGGPAAPEGAGGPPLSSPASIQANASSTAL